MTYLQQADKLVNCKDTFCVNYCCNEGRLFETADSVIFM